MAVGTVECPGSFCPPGIVIQDCATLMAQSNGCRPASAECQCSAPKQEPCSLAGQGGSGRLHGVRLFTEAPMDQCSFSGASAQEWQLRHPPQLFLTLALLLSTGKQHLFRNCRQHRAPHPSQKAQVRCSSQQQASKRAGRGGEGSVELTHHPALLELQP